MNSSAASTTPTETAMTMSKNTVSRKQVSSTSTSLLRRDAHDADEVVQLGHVPGDETSSAASAAIGRYATSGASTSIAARTKSACVTAAERRARAGADVGRGARERAGRRDAAEERRDDVADAERDSSAFGSCLVSVMPSATTADSSDSIAPSMAIANAAGSSSRTSA